MIWILVLLTAGIFVTSLLVFKEKYNPITLFSGFWLVLMLLSTFEFFNIKKANQKVYLIVLVGVFSYAIGCFIASKVNVKFVIEKKNFSTTEIRHDLNYKIVCSIVLIISLIMIVYFMRTMMIMLQGYPLNYIRSNFSSLIIHNEFERLAWNFIIWPLALAIMPIGLYASYVERKSKWYLFASLLNTILLSVCSGGRVYLMFYVIQIIFFTIFTKEKISFKSRIIHNITLIFISIVVVGIAIYISNERQITTSIAEGLYSYFIGCFKYFDYQLEQIGGNGYGYGIYFLNSPITFGLMILKNVGLIEYPAGFLTVQSSINALQNYTKVGNNWFNSFATCFYYFYRDGGFVGIIIESGIYGFFSYRTFKNLKEKSQAREIILYSVILITIFTSMVRWQFGRPEFFMVVVYIMLLTKKHSKRG